LLRAALGSIISIRKKGVFLEIRIYLYVFIDYYNGAISKATSILGTNIVKAIAIGNN
jgi:hypothetical protein